MGLAGRAVRWLRDRLAPQEELVGSEQLAALARWAMLAFVLVVNRFVSPYWGPAGFLLEWVLLLFALGNLAVTAFLMRRLRPSRPFSPLAFLRGLLALLVVLGNLATLAIIGRDYASFRLALPFTLTLGAGSILITLFLGWAGRPSRASGLFLHLLDIVFVSTLLALAPKFRETPYDILYLLVILLVALRLGLAPSILLSLLSAGLYALLAILQPAAFATIEARNAMLATRSFGYLGIGTLGGILAQLVRVQQRRREEERRRTREQEVVLRVASAISTTLELDRLMEQVFISLREIIPFTEGEITLWSGEEGCLVSRSLFTPEGYIPREIRYAPGEGYSGWMAVHRQPLWIPDIAAEKAVRPKAELTSGAYLGVPLLLGDRLVGTLELAAPRPGTFHREDLDILVATAPQVAAMLDHARLYDRVRQRLEERVRQLGAIEQIDRELSGTLELPRVIQGVLDRAMEFTGATVGALLGMTERRDGLLILASRGYQKEMERYQSEPWPLEAGIVGRVARTRRPALVEDVSQDADYADATGTTRSELAVPIMREEEVLGVLNLESDWPAAFTEEHLEFVQHLAEHAAIAIHNARLFAREQQRSRELAALQEVALDLSRKLEVADLLQSVVERAVQLLGAGSGALYVTVPEAGELELRVAYNMPEEYLGTRLKVGEGLAGQVAQNRRPMWVDDYRTFAGRSAHYAGADFRAVIAVPLLYGDELLGVLDVLHGEEGRTFGESDLRLLLPLANQAAVALSNARLFEETRSWAEQMALLLEVNRALTSTLGFQETVQALVQGIQRLVPYSEGEICLYDPDRQTFTTVATLGEMVRAASAGTYTLEQGYTGWIGRNRRPLLIGDCASFTEVRPVREEMITSGRLRSYLGLPMLIGDRLIGTLELVSEKPYAFTERHLRLLTLVAGQAAVSLDNARLYGLTERRLRQRMDQLLALQRIGRELNTTLLLEDNLRVIIEEAIRATSSTHGNIAMYDEEAGAFRVTSALVGYTPEEARLLKQLRLGRGRSLMDDVLRSGQPEIVADTQADPRPACVKRETRSALSMPILFEGRVVGIINVRSTEPGAYDQEDLQFIQTLATQASLAVGNARRYEELTQQRELVSQRATQLREILELGNTLRADRDLSDILGQVAYGVVGSVGFGVVLFSLVAEDHPTVLERVASAGIPLEDFQRLQEVRPPLQVYRDLFRDEFRISRSYFIPEEAVLALSEEYFYRFPGMVYEEELAADEWHPHDLLLVPMYSSAGDLLGIMSLDNPFDRKRPVRRVVEALEIFANQAAIAVENGRLFRERERRIAELNVLNRIGQATTSTLDLDAILLSIYERLAEARVLDVESFYIAIYDAGRDTLRFYPVVDRGVLYEASESPARQGMAGRIVQERRPLLIEDIAQAEREGKIEYVSLAGWEGERTQSYLGVPMLVGEELVGVIAAQSYRKAAYGEREKQFLLTVANQVAVAIQNARLFREREQRLAELAILNEIGRALSSTLRLEELVEVVHNQVSRIFDTTNFYIAYYDEASDEWETLFEIEEGKRIPPERYKVGAGLTGYIIRHKSPLLFRSQAEIEAFHQEQGITTIGRPALSWLGVPLIAADKVVGVMAIQSYEKENLYSEQDLALFSTIAAQAAIAMDNARLFRERERRITELAILNEIGRALSSTLERDQVTRAIYEQVGRILDTTNFYIALYDEEHREWETVLDIIGHQPRPPMRYSVEQGLTGFIIRNRQPLLFHTSAELEAFEKTRGYERIGERAKSWLGVPMIAADRVVGVIGVESYEREHAYTEDDLAVLSTVAAQAAVALENARLFEETRQRLQQVNTLLEVSRDVATRLDLPTLLQSILEAAVRSVPAAERGSILLLDEKAQELVVAAQIGYPDEVRREVRLKLDEGFAGWVCREGRADIVVDARTDPRFLMTESSRDIRAIMSAPLIGRRGLVGVINLDNLSRPGVFGRQDLEFLSGLAHQAAVAIENARLFEERERYAQVLEARVRELSALLEGTRAITSTLQLGEVLDALVSVVGRQMDVATVALWRVEGEDLVPAAALGLPERFMHEVRLRVGEGLSGHVAATGKVLAVPDVAQLTPELRNPAGAAFDQELDLHAYLGVPITYQERVLGVLSVMAHEVRDFTPDEVALLTGLAEQAGIAVENARLFQEREQRIAELTVLNEVGRAISTTMRLDELLETIRREAARLVDTSNFLVALYDERTHTLSFPLYHEFGQRMEMPSRTFGNGLTEYVIRQRAPVLISGDTEAFCREHGIEHRGNPAKSWLAVPLIYMDRVIGIMALQDYEHVGAYDEHHVRLLSTLAGQAAVTIQNARLFSDLEASRTELEARLIQLGALQEMGRTISGTLEMDTVLDAVLEAVTATIGFSYAVISLVDEEAGEVRAIRGIGVSPEQIAGSRRTLDSPDIMADIVRTGKTEVIDGWDDRFDREMYEKFGHARLVRVFAPLVARGKVIGLIEAGYPREVRAAITQDDVEVLQMFLAQAAIAIDNAQMFAEIRRFSEELERMVEARTRQLEEEKSRLEALHAITTELSSTLDLDEILLKTIDLASVATGRSLGMVLLRDPASGDLVCRAMLDAGNVLRPGRQVIPLAEAGALRKVLEERATLRIDDVSRDPQGQTLPLLPAGTRSVAAVPLVSAEEVVGIILLTHSQVGFFDEDQMRLLSTLGGEVATAIHNAELYSYINDQALRLSEMLTYQQEEASKVRAILQSIADGVIVVDRENRIILANPASQQILGMAREELEGRFTHELPGLFQPGGLFAQENPRFELMDRYINVSSTPVVTDAGEMLGRVYVLRDITREVEADRAKSEFISTVSHELRTPLTSIKGYVDLILLGSVGEITPMQRNFLEVVRSNSNRLVDLINDLLDISRIETGRIVLSPEPLSIFDVVEEVVESARAEIERKQLTLEVRVPPDLPLVHADRKRITQVLTNLVSNAYKYTREGGRVEISARCENGFLTVSVSDTGVGISKEDQKKLFTRFFRADNPLRDEVGGTGLGLAISKSFVEMHGGKMWVESELNVGSTFSFSLPLTQPPAGRQEEQGETRPAGTTAVPGARILVVDDEPNITELLRYLLERAGYRVYTARRGEEALAIARQEHPDLITLDILMAGMDGQEVLERLKADERTADIPVVIISIVAEKENLMALGAVDFLPKPLEEAELLLTIGRILGRPGETATVLVADDDPDIVGWLRRVLTEQGYQVYEAADGEEALEAALAVLPDLIVLDLRMPKMDGREVITRLKLREETCEIPIIVITASSVDRETDRVQILGLGAEGFLTKPFPAEQLIREIEAVLRKKTEATK